ncbi:hypothetical protein K440DRAFT_408917 [Wilcoxina mikolae CBS 423.85]|nr:hypothetical protein K440DRAFT_408917 [Wilcoxina mikolae CBS 423.85]
MMAILLFSGSIDFSRGENKSQLCGEPLTLTRPHVNRCDPQHQTPKHPNTQTPKHPPRGTNTGNTTSVKSLFSSPATCKQCFLLALGFLSLRFGGVEPPAAPPLFLTALAQTSLLRHPFCNRQPGASRLSRFLQFYSETALSDSFVGCKGDRGIVNEAYDIHERTTPKPRRNTQLHTIPLH